MPANEEPESIDRDRATGTANEIDGDGEEDRAEGDVSPAVGELVDAVGELVEGNGAAFINVCSVQ